MVTALPPARETPPATADWPGAGVVLSGRYHLSHCIATGSSAVVWQAHDHQLERDVAVKLLLPHRQSDPVARNRFHVEALATVRATHPNAVRVYDAASHDTMTYLVMELVDGRSLAGLQRPLRAELLAAVGAQVAGALGAAHDRDLIHRDVKPGNVLIDRTGWIKVVDFGIAKLLDASSSLTRGEVGVGTARYLAPEQLLADPVGPWTDLYGLGLTLWELGVGRPVFPGTDVEAVVRARLEAEVPSLHDAMPDVPPEVADIVDALTRRDPTARPSDAHVVVDALQSTCGPRPHVVTRSLVSIA